MKINKKYAPYLFATIMAVAMGGLMSFFLTWINTGMDSAFVMRWMRSFGIGTMVAFPVSIMIAPIAQKIVVKFTEE